MEPDREQKELSFYKLPASEGHPVPGNSQSSSHRAQVRRYEIEKSGSEAVEAQASH